MNFMYNIWPALRDRQLNYFPIGHSVLLPSIQTYAIVTTRLAKARIHLLRVHTNDKSKYTVILSQNKILIIY